jgi:hypothetical protein
MRIDRTTIKTYAQTHPEPVPGCMLEGHSVPTEMFYFWKKASASQF